MAIGQGADWRQAYEWAGKDVAVMKEAFREALRLFREWEVTGDIVEDMIEEEAERRSAAAPIPDTAPGGKAE